MNWLRRPPKADTPNETDAAENGFTPSSREFLWQRPNEACAPEFPFVPLPSTNWPFWSRRNPIAWFFRRRSYVNLTVVNIWAWTACSSPYDRSVLGFIFGNGLPADDPSFRDFKGIAKALDYSVERYRRWSGADGEEVLRMAYKHRALVWAKLIGDRTRETSDEAAMQTASREDQWGFPQTEEDFETRLHEVLAWMEFACEDRAKEHGATYGTDLCWMLSLLCGVHEPVDPTDEKTRMFGAPSVENARFAGRRLELCEAILDRVQLKFGRGSNHHRWYFAWCIRALTSEAKQSVDVAAVRRRWLEQLLDLERAAAPIQGMIHLGSAVLMAAEDAKQRGDLTGAETILRDGARDMQLGIDGLPTRYQEVRRALVRLLILKDRTDELEPLLRDMIRVEEEEHTPDALPLRTLMGPAIGWLRVRLARLLERRGHIDEAEQCYRAAVGDRFGVRSQSTGIQLLIAFLKRQQRASAAITAIDEAIRRERAVVHVNDASVVELLIIKVQTIGPSRETTDREHEAKLAAAVQELLPMLQKIHVDPPFFTGAQLLLRGAYTLARVGFAEEGLELLRFHIKNEEEGDAKKRESSVWLFTMYAFCLEHLENQIGEQIATHPDSEALAARRTVIRAERRKHLTWSVPLLLSQNSEGTKAKASPWVDFAQRSLADAMSEEGDHEAACTQLEEALARSKRAVPPSPRMTWMIGRALIDVLEKLHRFDEVMALRERFPDHGPTGSELVDGDPDLDERDEPIGDGESTDGGSGGEDSDGDDGDLDHGDPDEPGRV